MAKKVKVGIVGATGYAGGELVRLLLQHPEVELTVVTSESSAGKPLGEALPGVRFTALHFERFAPETIVKQCEVVFLAGEHGFAMKHAASLLEAGCTVVDLSADFRLKDRNDFRQWYQMEHTAPALLQDAVYGLPEVRREKIRGARFIANPGCYPTATILALKPFLERGLLHRETVVIDAKSGVSGAGRAKHSLDFHFPELNESVRAYGVGGVHRHTPEIEQELSGVAGARLRLTFTPHLIPITRGILSTCYGQLCSELSVEAAHQILVDAYAQEPFVVVYEVGKFPATKATYGTNFCHIGVAVDSRTGRLVVVSAIDNLVKGAAGQAVQNMNISLGLSESAGLLFGGVWP